jgi:FkbM family methyltransferase
LKTVTTSSGEELYFPNTDTHFTGQKRGRLVCEDYQVDRLYAAYDFVTDFAVAVDIGAHVGLMTRQLAKRFTYVYAFEPDPDNFACLAANTKRLPNVEIFNVALGAKDGKVGLLHDLHGNSGNIQVTDQAKGFPMTTLDSFRLVDAGLIKIDVQGYEPFVLEGAAATIHAHAPVVIVEVEKPKKLMRSYDGESVDKFFAERKAPMVTSISADRIYSPGPSGVRPFVKYAERGDYHWRDDVTSADYFRKPIEYINSIRSMLPAGALLDIGCGDGAVTHALDAFGIDDNAQALAMARRHRVRCQQLSAYRLRYLRGEYSAALLFDVLEHLDFPEHVLNGINFLGCKHLFVLNPEDAGGDVKSRWHVNEFSAESLRAFMAKYGWRVNYGPDTYAVGKNREKTFWHFMRP